MARRAQYGYRGDNEAWQPISRSHIAFAMARSLTIPRVRLDRLVQAHDRFTKASRGRGLAQHFGDGYLLQRNPIYRDTRNFLLAKGYRYTVDRSGAYQAFAMAALPDILRRRNVPYVNNMTRLRAIAKRRPAITADTTVGLFTGNTTLHETAHGCVHEITKAWPRPSNRRAREQQLALQIMLGESFANTCDVMVWSHATTKLDHVILRYNSYCWQMPRFFRDVTWTATKRRNYFAVLCFAFLYSNFLFDGFDRAAFKRVTALLSAIWGAPVTFTATERSELIRTVNRDIYLDQTFRLMTGDFYFKLIGIKQEHERALDFDFMTMLESNSTYQTSIKRLFNVLFA